MICGAKKSKPKENPGPFFWGLCFFAYWEKQMKDSFVKIIFTCISNI
jgi:hypothetical protein